MIEEREYRAARFWRDFDTICRSEFDGSNEQFTRASLLIYFLLALRTLERNNDGGQLSYLVEQLLASHEYEFRDRWSSLMSEVVRSLCLSPPVEVNRRFFERAAVIVERVLNEPDFHPGYFFDHRFVSLASDADEIDPRHTHLIAVLSNTLATHAEVLVDAFCTTGELFATSGGERWRRREHHQQFAIMRKHGSLDFELRMRLALYGVNTSMLTEKDFIDSLFSPRAFVQIDTPPVVSVRKPYNFGASWNINFEEATSGKELLWGLLAQGRQIDGLIVVSGVDRTGIRGWIRELRVRLINSGMLIAILDLPRINGSKNRSMRSVWVLGSRTQHAPNEILAVDLGALGHVRSHFECGVIAEFAGRLVRCFQGHSNSSRWASLDMGVEKDRLRQVFEREFGNGYRNVAGLCRSVRHEEILYNNEKLVASFYIGQQVPPVFLSGIDGGPIMSELIRNEGHGKSFYVIGNNGEGKSLLLRELAESASRQGRKTIGISFGTADRFPFGRKAKGFDQFSYEGARTSTDSASARKAAVDICRKLFEIHCDSKRLKIFSHALELLEFDAKRFIVPFDGQRLVAELNDFAERMFELTDDPNFNRELTTTQGLSKMQAAFMRNRSKGGITPFSELSSGEQQMLALTIKFIASAETGCLILVDEPEISLHVRWQLLIPTLFRQLRHYFDCDIVVATHSPLVISGTMEPHDLCFAARRQQLKRISARDQSSVESILFAGFGTHTENNRLVHERCAALVAEGIRIANSPNNSPLELDHLTNELAEIRRTVKSSKKQIERTSLQANLELIEKTHAALVQIKSWNQGGSSVTDEVPS
jgi:ABC-type transport system involved in cytochrome c biogenesis ATPase subunit